MRNIVIALALTLPACSEGCKHAGDARVDPGWRQSQLSVHRVEGGDCVALFVKDDGGAAMTVVTCPEGAR